MRQALATIAVIAAGTSADPLTLPWGQLRHVHTAAIRAQLADRYAPKTARKMLTALKGTLKAAWRLGLITADDYAAAVDVAPVRGSRPKKGRALANHELRMLLEACAGDGARGARDAALLAVALGCGLRRAELVALDRDDYSPRDETITVRAGKGNKARRVFVPPDVQGYLDTWLRLHAQPAIFVAISKSGRVLERRLSAPAVRSIFVARAGAADVDTFSPHDLRRTMITTLLAAGEDLVTVQQMAGHADIKTTASYDRRGEDAQRRAARRLTLG
jgi:integrase